MPDLERDLRALFADDARDVDPRSRERLLASPARSPRRTWLYVGVVAAVLVLIMGIALVGRSRTTPEPAVAVPPPGATQVGFEGVGVTVPDAWVSCPTTPGVLTLTTGTTCRDGVLVAMGPLDSGFGRDVRNAMRTLSKTSAGRTDKSCVYDGTALPVRCEVYVALPEQGVAVAVSADEADTDIDAVAASVTPLPDDQVAVPVLPSGGDLLAVSRLVSGADLTMTGYMGPLALPVTALIPTSGTVVARGSSVRYRVDPTSDLDLSGTWNLAFARRLVGMSITFDGDGSMSANDGCSVVEGRYDETGDGPAFADLHVTSRVDCDNDDPDVLGMLGQIRGLIESEKTVRLLDGEGRVRGTLTSRLTTPKPRPITLAGYEHSVVSGRDRFRPYTGPTHPAFTEQDALDAVHDPGAVSLGYVDLGRGPRWQSVVVVAAVAYVADSAAYSSGPAGSEGPHRPAWVRRISMYDVATGRFTSGASY